MSQEPDPKFLRPELRILQVVSTLGVGGAEMWLIAFLRYLKEANDVLPYRVKVDICLTSGLRGSLDDEAEALGASLFYRQYSKRTLPSFARGLRALLRSRNYHAMHDHQEHSAGLHLLLGAGLLPKVRAVHFHNPTTFRARNNDSAGGRLVTTIGFFLAKRFGTHMLGTSAQTLREQRVDQVNVPVRVYSGALHCGFDTRRFAGDQPAIRTDIRKELGWEDSSKILLFVGRLHMDRKLNQKNPGFALDVAAECMSSNPEIRMIFVGDGADGQRELERRSATFGIADRIRFLGVRSDVPRLMLGSDAMLFPTFAEGLGMVAVEAQAAGLRVLASDVVPKECVVVPDLVTFMPLAVGAARWAGAMRDILALPLPNAAECNRAVSNSAFSIESSAQQLLDVYAGRRP